MLSSLVSFFAVSNGCRPPEFFGLKPWYWYLETDNKCNVINFDVLGGTSGSDFVLIAVAMVDNLLRIIGFVAIGYLIYGGITYITSQGAPDQTAKAQSTIQNALIGLVIALVAIAFVSFLGNRLG